MILNKNKNEVDLSSILSAILFFFFFFFFFKSLFCYSFSLSTLIFTIIIIINHHYPIHFIHILISSKFHFFSYQSKVSPSAYFSLHDDNHISLLCSTNRFILNICVHRLNLLTTSSLSAHSFPLVSTSVYHALSHPNHRKQNITRITILIEAVKTERALFSYR